MNKEEESVAKDILGVLSVFAFMIVLVWYSLYNLVNYHPKMEKKIESQKETIARITKIIENTKGESSLKVKKDKIEYFTDVLDKVNNASYQIEKIDGKTVRLQIEFGDKSAE